MAGLGSGSSSWAWLGGLALVRPGFASYLALLGQTLGGAGGVQETLAE